MVKLVRVGPAHHAIHNPESIHHGMHPQELSAQHAKYSNYEFHRSENRKSMILRDVVAIANCLLCDTFFAYVLCQVDLAAYRAMGSQGQKELLAFYQKLQMQYSNHPTEAQPEAPGEHHYDTQRFDYRSNFIPPRSRATGAIPQDPHEIHLAETIHFLSCPTCTELQNGIPFDKWLETSQECVLTPCMFVSFDPLRQEEAEHPAISSSSQISPRTAEELEGVAAFHAPPSAFLTPPPHLPLSSSPSSSSSSSSSVESQRGRVGADEPPRENPEMHPPSAQMAGQPSRADFPPAPPQPPMTSSHPSSSSSSSGSAHHPHPSRQHQHQHHHQHHPPHQTPYTAGEPIPIYLDCSPINHVSSQQWGGEYRLVLGLGPAELDFDGKNHSGRLRHLPLKNLLCQNFDGLIEGSGCYDPYKDGEKDWQEGRALRQHIILQTVRAAWACPSVIYECFVRQCQPLYRHWKKDLMLVERIEAAAKDFQLEVQREDREKLFEDRMIAEASLGLM